MAERISVIIPVYNVAPYLAACVQSVIQQTYSELEILLIDDGSTDGSGALCDQWAARDPRIKVFHRLNQGLSVSRNFGLQQASGVYCLFLDSDDYLVPQAVAQARSKMAPFVDMVFYERQVLTPDGQLTPLYANDLAGFCTPQALLTGLLMEKIRHYATAYLVRTALFQKGQIQFPPQVNFEDVATTYRLVLQARQIYYLAAPLYIYRIRAGSISQTKTTKDRQDLLTTTQAFITGIQAVYPDRERLDHYLLTTLRYLLNDAQTNYQAKHLAAADFHREYDQYHALMQPVLARYPKYRFLKLRLLHRTLDWQQYTMLRTAWQRLKPGIK